MISRNPPAPVSAPRARRLLAAATLALALVPLAGPAARAQAVSSLSKNAAAAAPDSPYHGAVVEDIVARVNDQVISSSDYQRALDELEAQAKEHNMPPAQLEEQKQFLLRDLIDNQLLLSKGKQLGITGEADTIRQLDELRKQNNLDSMEALEKAAEQQGVSFADFKASIQNRVITSQVIREEVGRRINITQGDEQAYYDAHKDQFTTPEEVKLSEILISTPDPDNAAQVATAQTKADELEGQLKSGKDFAALAKADSGGSTAAQGGALGEYKRGQLGQVLEDATFSLKPGEYTAPIRTKQGFVILKVDGHTAAGLEPFSQAEGQVEDAIGMQKMQPALRAYLTRLREEAYIEVKPGFTDASASSNEMRPVFSAYQPPQPKKKKPVERTRFSGRGRTSNAVQMAKNTAPAPAAPAGVQSLADVPGGNGTPGMGLVGNGAVASTQSPAPSTGAKAQTASTMKPGKREKVRFGQAPRETLPSSETHTQDAGASAADGNAATGEKSGETAVAQSTGPGNGPTGMHYENGESATEDQAEAKKGKTRFSERAVVPKAVKAERKAKSKADPFPAPAPDNQELADKSTQDKPLGLAGDTSKKPPKPRPTGEKTRYSDEAGKKNEPAPSTAGTQDVTTPLAPTTSQTPAVTTQPYQEPSTERSPGTNPPVNTQTTPTGSGDPLGPTNTPPSQPQR